MLYGPVSRASSTGLQRIDGDRKVANRGMFLPDDDFSAKGDPDMGGYPVVGISNAVVEARGLAAAAEHPVGGEAFLEADRFPKDPPGCAPDRDLNRFGEDWTGWRRVSASHQLDHKAKGQKADRRARDRKRGNRFGKPGKIGKAWARSGRHRKCLWGSDCRMKRGSLSQQTHGGL